jgi:hypothetical protein
MEPNSMDLEPLRDEQPIVNMLPEFESTDNAHSLSIEAAGRLTTAARVPFETNTETSACEPEGKEDVHTA